MMDDTIFTTSMFFGGMALGAFFVGLTVKTNVDDHWRDELARRGHAHYYLDQDNRRQWNWKEEAK